MRRFSLSRRNRVLLGGIPFLFLLFLGSQANAQWVSVMPPEVSADWELNKIKILSAGNGWTVGTDAENKQGALLFFKNHSWIVVEPPNVSSDWELNGVTFSSVTDVWAVGIDFSGGTRKGIMLHYINGVWTIVTPPYVSTDWGLQDVHFLSSSDGWAVGADYASRKGILLHFSNGVWTSFTPPELSLDWGLFGVHMVSSNEVWAAGVDRTNKRGAILHYTKDPTDKSTLRKRFIWEISLPPQIPADWELKQIHFVSTTEGWAAGVNHTEKRGALLHFLNSNWAEVIPPAVSADWELNSVYFPSSTSGWAVGVDHVNKRGVAFEYDRGLWTTSGLPEVSSDWDLASVRFLSVSDGWAAGRDSANKKGVLLRFTTSANETISTPATPNGPTNIGTNVPASFFTGESLSSLDHSVQYFLDWGDGTNSGWLPTGTVGATKSWATPGTYQVKAQARCDTDTSEVSKTSSGLSVTVSDQPTPVALASPPDGTVYDGCSLYSLPTFAWTADGSFTGYEIQFSETESFDMMAASAKTSSTSILIDDSVWKKVLAVHGTSASGSSNPATGGPVFLRVIGTRSDKVAVVSGTLSIFIDAPQPVGNLTITNTSKSTVPTVSWDNNCNIKFKVWFGNNSNFTRKTSFSFNIKDPTGNGGVFTDTLASTQWISIQQLVGKVSGAPIYWYLESWDGANRRIISQPPQSFVLSD